MTKRDEARYIGAWLELNRISDMDELKAIASFSVKIAGKELHYSFNDLDAKLVKTNRKQKHE